MAKFFGRKDHSSKFYWILVSDKNGKTVARSSESYDSRSGMENSIEWTRNNAVSAVYVDEAR